VSAPPSTALLSVETARDAVLVVAEPVGAEWVAAADAFGRVTGETVTARVSWPPWANSPLDGYAIRAADTNGARDDTPSELRVIGDIAADAAPDVRVRVRPASGRGSHVTSPPAAADAPAVIPEADDALPAGAEVAPWWLDRA